MVEVSIALLTFSSNNDIQRYRDNSVEVRS